MEKSEFVGILHDRQWRNFYFFAGTENVKKGENVYHWCGFCSYATGKTKPGGSSDRIDRQIANHLWENHRSEATKIALEMKAQQLASRPGQTKLEV